MLITVADATVESAGVNSIDVGSVRVGPISVGQLVVDNTQVSMNGAEAKLRNVSVAISIHISLDWHVHVGMPDWIPDIDVGDTYDLGSLHFGPLGVGDIDLPALNNIDLTVPTVTGGPVGVQADPLPLSIGSVGLSGVDAHNVALPSDGFSLTGLGLGAVEVSQLGVPAASVESATVARVVGDTIHIPALSLHDLTAQGVQIPSASTTAPLDIPANLATQSVGFDAGILSVHVHLTPSATSHVDMLELHHAAANAQVGRITLTDVALPFEVLNMTLGQIGLTNLAIPTIAVS